MEKVSFASLIIVVIAAFITPILLNKLRLRVIPVVIGEIVAGLVIGKSGFDLVGQDVWIKTLSTLGFIYLLFLSGLEIDFTLFTADKKGTLENGKKEPNNVVVAITVFAMILITSFLLSLLFVWAGLIKNAFLMTLLIGTISLGIIVPTLKDSGIIKSSIGQMILLIAAAGDLITMVLLAIFVSIHSNKGSSWLILILFLAGVLLYFVGKFLLNKPFFEKMARGTIHIDTRAVFLLIIIMVGLSEKLGVEYILGSFLAGALVSLFSPDPEMVQKLDSFGYGFLIPIFFVITGVKLDVLSLFSNRSTLVLMPLLLIAFFIAKLVPSILIRRWYGWRTSLSIGFLTSAKLTLVIAAVRAGEKLHMISDDAASAAILVAVISCIVGPILFKSMFPKHHAEAKKNKVALIGANQITLPLSLELGEDSYETTVYHSVRDKIDDYERRASFNLRELPDYSIDSLKDADAFDADILVVSAGEEEMNAAIAEDAKEHVKDRVIAKIESLNLIEKLREKGIETYSSFFSTKAILKAMIKSPDFVDIFTTEENGFFELEMHNHMYVGTKLRDFPHLGDTIIVRIYRDNNSIVPHGDTELKMDDRLIITGSRVHIERMEEILGG